MSGDRTLGQVPLKTETFCITDGPASAVGNFVFKIVNRPLDAEKGNCAGAAIFSYTQNYDGTADGDPTTAEEIRNAAEAGLSAVPPPAGFTVDPTNIVLARCISIASTTQWFDVCVDGTLIAPGLNAYAENALNVGIGTAGGKTKIPTVSEWGLAVMAILMLTAATVVIMRRRAAVA